MIPSEIHEQVSKTVITLSQVVYPQNLFCSFVVSWFTLSRYTLPSKGKCQSFIKCGVKASKLSFLWKNGRVTNIVVMRLCGILYFFSVTPAASKNSNLFFIGSYIINRQLALTLRKGHLRAYTRRRKRRNQSDTQHNLFFGYNKEFHIKSPPFITCLMIWMNMSVGIISHKNIFFMNCFIVKNSFY